MNLNHQLIKEKKSNKVLFAGKIAKPKFSSLRLDFKGIYYMPSVIKAAKLGDAAIFLLYTLRAHETKAKLVCRLLLEKTKAPIQQIIQNYISSTHSY